MTRAAKRHLEDAGEFDDLPATSARRGLSASDVSGADTDDECAESCSLARDLGHLRNLQRLNPTHNRELKYVQYRGLLVSFIIDVCEDLKLMPVTMHRSLNYLDRLLSKHTQISRQCYQLVATACILVSAKFEEQPQNVPTLMELGRLCAVSTGQDSKQQLIAAEKILLETLDWNAHSATHLHFSHSYIGKGVLYPNDTIDSEAVTPSDKRIIVRCIELIAKLCLEEYSFLKYEPSLAAAAGVAVARRFCKVCPVWPEELEEMSGYTVEDIRECYDSIQKLFTDNFPECQADLERDQSASPKCITSMSFGPEPSPCKMYGADTPSED